MASLNDKQEEVAVTQQVIFCDAVDTHRVIELLSVGLDTDDAQHKQWALWKLVELLKLEHEFVGEWAIEDKGVAP